MGDGGRAPGWAAIKLAHRRAMAASDLALLAELRNDAVLAARHKRVAFAFEAMAAEALVEHHDAEPARSVLLHSAATLGQACGEFADAEALIRAALAGSPPAAIAAGLRALLETNGAADARSD